MYPCRMIRLTISIKKAPTIGTTMNACGDGPNRLTKDPMFITAVGVAPKPKPQWPPDITAAS